MNHSGRAEFLRCFFGKLDAAGVAWCCLRNHTDVFVDSRSDVDLLVLPEDKPLFERFLEESCRETGTRLAQKASYLNFSRTYITPAQQWVRIDYEAEVRWRIFPLLHARRVLLRRIRSEDLWIAGPADEALVLWLASVFRQSLGDRYRTRLGELDAATRKNPVARGVYQEALGRFGLRLQAHQGEWLTKRDLRFVWHQFKAALIQRVWVHPPLAVRCFGYACFDALRIWQRLWHPPGIVVQIESAQWHRLETIEFLWLMDRIFPTSKSVYFNQAPDKLSGPHKFSAFRSLFKGGLVLFLAPVGQTHLGGPGQRRVLSIRETSKGNWTGASWPSGLQTHSSLADPVMACHQLLISALTTEAQSGDLPQSVFCAAIGLDGSGKTTLAKKLAELIPATAPHPKFHYYHFLPAAPRPSDGCRLFDSTVISQLKKHPTPRGPLESVLRLGRNWIRAWWGILLSRRKCRGVLFGDRYLYNYLLDPVSVCYFGPSRLAAWLLRWAPQPDLIFVLDAPPETILQRKQELTPLEVRIQNERLRKIPWPGKRVIRLDGTRPPGELAQQCLAAILSCCREINS